VAIESPAQAKETAPAQAAPVQLEQRARLAVLGAILLALFLSSLDQTIVGTALPRIVTELQGGNLYTWVVTSYLLTSTVTVPVYGKLSDLYGRRPLLLIGVGIFLLGSALSGQSRSMNELIAFRAVQGLGAGALFPIALAVIGDLFSPRERGRYQGLFGAVFGLSFILGPFLGGYLTDNVSWRWVFYVNLPIGILALAVIVAVMPNLGRRPASYRDLDYLGIALFTAAVVPILIGLTNKGQLDSSGHLNDWTAPTVGGLILAGLVVLAVFAWVESRAPEPIVPLDLFRHRTYTLSQVAVFVVAFGMFTSVIYLPRYYQAVRGVSATQSGYEIWPLLAGLIGGSILTGALITRTGRYKWLMLGSMVLLVVGAFLMTHLDAGTSSWVLWSWMLLMGLGIGPSMAGFTVIVQGAVPASRLGVATSNLTFFRQIGGSVGLAIAGTLFNSTFANTLPAKMIAAGVPREVVDKLGGGSTEGALTGVGDLSHLLAAVLPAQLQPLVPKIIQAVHDAESAAIAELFWLTVAAGIAAMLCILFLEEIPLRGGARQGQA
jgi:EmrB/QacA subfamily drug resistance transporter